MSSGKDRDIDGLDLIRRSVRYKDARVEIAESFSGTAVVSGSSESAL